MKLEEMNIKMISLVKQGANRKEIIYKNESLKDCLVVNFTKSNEEQGVVYGIVYAPNEVDTQGDYATGEEILKASYGFMKSSNTTTCVDVEHSLDPVGAYICESWIVKQNDPLFSEVGAWAVGIKLEDENLKQMVKSGEIAGLSMFGTSAAKKSVISSIKDIFKRENKMDEKSVAAIVEKKIDEKFEELQKSMKEMVTSNNERLAKSDEKLDAIEKQLSKSTQVPNTPANNSVSGGIL